MNVVLSQEESPVNRVESIIDQVTGYSKYYDAILCVSGGWEKGSVKDQDVFDQYEKLENEQVFPALLGIYSLLEHSLV